MKRLNYLFAILSVCMVGCADKTSYKITGTVENAMDGDTVFIQQVQGQELIKADYAIVKGQKFSFTGKQDSTVSRYLTYTGESAPYFTDFLLENGDIKVNLSEISTVRGTKNNNIYQDFKDKIISLTNEQQEYYNDIQMPGLSEEQEASIIEKIQNKEEEITETVRKSIADNITNPVGIHLLTQYHYILDFDQLSAVLDRVPANYRNNEVVEELNESVNMERNVAVGKKFTDLTMFDPQGNTVKLSDYVSNNKYTLIDFWASWCGPCRQEMPAVIELYNEYRSKGLEIVGVSFDRDREDWLMGIEVLDIPWPQMSDLKMWESEGAKLYSIRGIPYTILIDQEGTIIEKGLRAEQLKQKFAELFN